MGQPLCLWLVSASLGSRSELTLPCHLWGCSLGVSDALLLVLDSYLVIILCEVLRLGNKCGCRCLFISTKIISFAVLEGHIFWAILCPFCNWEKCKGECSLYSWISSLFCINTAFYFPQLRFCKSTTIWNWASVLGALRQAVWCMDFCFCSELKNEKGLRLGTWPGNGWGCIVHESSVLNWPIMYLLWFLGRVATRLESRNYIFRGNLHGTH